MKSSLNHILNPYLPEYEYIPDGEPHVFGNRVYVYGSHDRFAGNVFCQNDYICYSAPVDDLNDWRYEGIIFSTMQDPRTCQGGHQFWAPDVVQGKDGRFYLYYCPDDTILSIGVAVCDQPAGRYEFLGLVKDEQGGIIGERPGDTYCFDPGVFIDDDGSIYLYSGNGPRIMEDVGKEPKASKVMKLKDDMMTIIGEPKKLLPLLHESEGTAYKGHEFFEASSIRKINGIYYLVYSSVTMHELCYATSLYPDRDFQYGGVIISNADIFENALDQEPKNCYGNNHGGIECINGQYYIFYHRHTNRSQYSRQGCAEPITFTEDGKILQTEMTSAGLYNKPLPAKGTYPASCTAYLRGKETPVISLIEFMGNAHPYLTQDMPDFDASLLQVRPNLRVPTQYIANCQDGLHVMYRYFDISGEKEMEVEIRGEADGELLIRNSSLGEVLGTISIHTHTDADQDSCFKSSRTWNTCSGKACFPEGVQEIHFEYVGSGCFDFRSITFR